MGTLKAYVPGTGWVSVGVGMVNDTRYLQKAGDTMSGVLNMGSQQIKTLANASGSTDAIPLGQADGRYLRLSGGTLTGFLTLHSDPTAAMHAVTRQYMDNVLAYMFADYFNARSLAVAFAANWVNYSPTPGFGPCQTTKLGNTVFINGLAKVNAAFTSGTICTIAAGHRPVPGNEILGLMCSSGTICRVDVSTAGVVSLSATPAVSLPVNGWISLQGAWKT